MTKTSKTTAARATSKKATRGPARTRRATAAGLALHVSPSMRRRARANLPLAAAIVVGGVAISTTIAMRREVARMARVIGDAGASGWKSVATAIPMDRWLVGAGLRRKPLWARALPALGVVGGLMAGAAVFFLVPRGEGARSVLRDSTDEAAHSTPVGSPSLADSFSEHEASANGRG
jgi:hypothetical protein